MNSINARSMWGVKSGYKILSFYSILGGVFFILLYFIYQPLIHLFFVQDDFFLLAISRLRNLPDVLLFFQPRVDTVWFRPISQQFFFGLTQRIFGLNPLLFHLIIFAVIALNGVLIYRFILMQVKTLRAVWIGALFYILHPAHFLSLAWPAAFAFVLGPTTYLLTIILYEYFVSTRQRYWYYLSLISFILSVLTVEVNVLLPFILVVQDFTKVHKNKNAQKKSLLMRITPFIVLSLFLLIWRYIIFPPMSISGEYQLEVGLNALRAAWWYALRLSGLIPAFRLDGPLMSSFHLLTVVLMVCSAGFILLRRTFSISRSVVIGVAIAIISLIPFILTPNHLSPHYLSFSLIGVALVLSDGINQVFQGSRLTLFTIVMIGIIIGLVFSGSIINYDTHWVVRRSKLAEKLIQQRIYAVSQVSEEYFALGANFAQHVYKLDQRE